jgi:hypothetical protein
LLLKLKLDKLEEPRRLAHIEIISDSAAERDFVY